jgi:hypothetical protein
VYPPCTPGGTSKTGRNPGVVTPVPPVPPLEQHLPDNACWQAQPRLPLVRGTKTKIFYFNKGSLYGSDHNCFGSTWSDRSASGERSGWARLARAVRPAKVPRPHEQPAQPRRRPGLRAPIAVVAGRPDWRCGNGRSVCGRREDRLKEAVLPSSKVSRPAEQPRLVCDRPDRADTRGTRHSHARQAGPRLRRPHWQHRLCAMPQPAPHLSS